MCFQAESIEPEIKRFQVFERRESILFFSLLQKQLPAALFLQYATTRRKAGCPSH